MAIRCSHCKHTTVHSLQHTYIRTHARTHTHSHTHTNTHTHMPTRSGFIQSIAEQHRTHTRPLSSIHIQSLQSRGDTSPVSVQRSTGGKSNKNSLAFSFKKKKNEQFFCSTTYSTICVFLFFFFLFVFSPSAVFHLCSLTQIPTRPNTLSK